MTYTRLLTVKSFTKHKRMQISLRVILSDILLSTFNNAIDTYHEFQHQHILNIYNTHIQWNLDITKSSVYGTIFFVPEIVKYMKKNLDVTKPFYSERILPVSWHFVISRLSLPFSIPYLKTFKFHEDPSNSLISLFFSTHPVTFLSHI